MPDDSNSQVNEVEEVVVEPLLRRAARSTARISVMVICPHGSKRWWG